MSFVKLSDVELPLPPHVGQRWGNWELLDTLVLSFSEDRRGREWSIYEIDLEQIRTAAQMLDWIFQIQHKTWATKEDQADLLQAFEDIFHPQAILCSFGTAGQIKCGEVRRMLRQGTRR